MTNDAAAVLEIYLKSPLHTLSELLGDKEVAEKFAAMSAPPDPEKIEELNAAGAKLHRHLDGQFPSISKKD